MTELRARYDAGLVEDDDDRDDDPVTVKMTRGDAGWLAVLLENAWDAGIPMEPPHIPLYAALRIAACHPVPYEELGRLAVEALGGVEPAQPTLKGGHVGPLGDSNGPPF